MSTILSKIAIDPIDERTYASLRDNFVYSKYTAQEIEALLDRLAKKNMWWIPIAQTVEHRSRSSSVTIAALYLPI